jgi:hypothetical protein
MHFYNNAFNLNPARYEVFTALFLGVQAFWDIMLHRWGECFRTEEM